ncbi:MAG: hypothetical protein HXS54_16710 [Theionarchaea archaeon]|nr:hypothetical protein [Theionarchaea archaeon]
MGKRKDGFTVDLNKDPLMRLVVSRLSVETIYWALLLHALVVIYVWLTGSLFELPIPPQIEANVDISELQMITPIRDPIFIAGIVFIIIVGYVWLRLSSDLPKALSDLKRNNIIKGKRIITREEKGNVVVLRKPFRFLDNLYTRKVLLPTASEYGKDIDDYEVFLARFETVLNTKLSYLFGIGGVVFFLYVLYQYTMKPSIEESLTLIWIDYRFFPVNTIIYEAIWVVGYFIIAVMIWKLLQIAIYIKRLFDEFETDIKPFHPDKCGGLKPITQIVVNINLFVFAAGIGFVIIYYSYLRALIPHIWVLFAGYIAVSIFLFFYPLIGARDSMRTNKERFLELFSAPLNHEYELIFQEFRDGIDDYDQHLDERHLSKVLTLRDFYDQAVKMPVWPFDRDTILAFLSRILLPLLLIVVNMIIARYFGAEALLDPGF